MTQNQLKSCIGKLMTRKRRAGAEVISSILLVAVTVVGAVILTSFLDETFVAGSLGASSNSDSVIKTVQLVGFDTRDGDHLMNIQTLNNTSSLDQFLCRNSCNSNTNPIPPNNGTEFMVIQIENKGVNPIFLHNIYLDGIDHTWDSSTAGVDLDANGGSWISNNFPGDGKFSILSTSTRCEPENPLPGVEYQCGSNEIINGETVNLIIKLDNINADIPLSKTIRAQFNIGDNQLSEVLIESGGAQ
jgi:hypothetical protein